MYSIIYIIVITGRFVYSVCGNSSLRLSAKTMLSPLNVTIHWEGMEVIVI